MGGIAMEKIAGKTKEQWIQEYPILQDVINLKETYWLNPQEQSCHGRNISEQMNMADIDDAEARLTRFAPYIAKAFPETEVSQGIIESELQEIPTMKDALETREKSIIPGKVYIKLDSHLPISGSVKARGGIYEVLKHAEEIAIQRGILHISDDYTVLMEPKFRQLFSEYSIVVGSTGNLGLSIGIMSAKLGFKVYVHMSTDAKQWKKDMLREKGAIVVEHNADYGKAVAAGRAESEKDPKSYFVDDENSQTLFLGYAVAAKRLQQQFDNMGISVDASHPLFVYIPCGVGGAPGGITFGLRSVFGDAVHCFFAEPTHSPAMFLGLVTGKHNEVSAQDFGIDNKTAADGLAVGRPSGLVGRTLVHDISGCFTISDERLYTLLTMLADTEYIFLEPSALAGFMGPLWLQTERGKAYLEKQKLIMVMPQATHVVWATGGGMVPKDVMQHFYCLDRL